MKNILSAALVSALCFVFFSFSNPPAAGKSLSGSHKSVCTRVKAQLCSDCGFGSKKDNCAKCNKWMGSTKNQAYLCGDCGFGSKKDNCVKCNKWVGSSGVNAQLCGDCSFGSKKDNCSKCSKWMGS
jgi:hypothetical protein